MFSKRLKRAVSGFLVAGMVLLGGSSAFAKVEAYVTQSNSSYYQYDMDYLIQSIINSATGSGSTALYERYQGERLVALKDHVNGYIDVDDVIDAIVREAIAGRSLNVDQYTESEEARRIELSGIKLLDAEGNVIEDDEPEELKIIDIY